ncbi:hypothetical protein BC829DRAFT_442913 [Chytridium lagenaria]|nr:hypothetical protein BC829DRAFT_442913 [Chytridium lagenaria]
MERLEESDVEADVIVGGDYGVAEAESVGLRDERVKRQTEMIATITRLINSEINQLAQSQATRDLNVRLESVRLATLVAQSKIQESRRVRATIKETARCATLLKARIEQTEKKIERIKSLKRGVVEKIFLDDAKEILEEDETLVDKAIRITELEEETGVRCTRFYRFLRACTGMEEELDEVLDGLAEEFGM